VRVGRPWDGRRELAPWLIVRGLHVGDHGWELRPPTALGGQAALAPFWALVLLRSRSAIDGQIRQFYRGPLGLEACRDHEPAVRTAGILAPVLRGEGLVVNRLNLPAVLMKPTGGRIT